MLVSGDGSLKNVFVHVKDGLDPTYSFSIPTEAVVLDQKGCIYTPRVIGVRVGQAIEIVNSDPTLHNVHAMPMQNQEFNKGQPFQGMRERQVFTVPEVMVRFMCNVHGWMAAHVGVVEHPFFAVTDDAGKFELKGIPPGTYTIEAWHEKFGRATERVTIGRPSGANGDVHVQSEPVDGRGSVARRGRRGTARADSIRPARPRHSRRAGNTDAVAHPLRAPARGRDARFSSRRAAW